MNNLKNTDMFDMLNNNLNGLVLRLSYLRESDEYKITKIYDSIEKLNECIAYMNYDIDEFIAKDVSCDFNTTCIKKQRNKPENVR